MLKARRMTREEYTARRHALVIDVLYGMPYADAAREYEMTGATVQQAVKNELLKLRRYHGHPLGLWWTGYHVPAKELYQRGVELVLLFDTMWKAQAK
jgi:hypothetical protein